VVAKVTERKTEQTGGNPLLKQVKQDAHGVPEYLQGLAIK
jgi:hypothetical protein